jgi:uncharacterized repeat protein (TIGR03803 family)
LTAYRPVAYESDSVALSANTWEELMAEIPKAHVKIIVLSGLSLLAMSPIITAHAETFQVLYDFTGQSDGAEPEGGLIVGPGNYLYGATTTRTPSSKSAPAFEFSSHGIYTVLAKTGENSEGDSAVGLVWQAGTLEFYGATGYGGTNGFGSVYKLNTFSSSGSGGGEITILHSFAGGSDGQIPAGRLVLDSSGNIYGTTYYGGDNTNCPYGCGTVYKITI